MPAEEVLDEFVNRIDQWIKSVNIIEPAFDDVEIFSILNATMDDLKSKGNNDLARCSYALYGYIDHLQKIYNKEKCLMDFAEESVWSIISSSYDNYGSDYKKWQVKFYEAVKENPLASKLNQLRNNCKSRVTAMEHRIEHVKKKADILLDLSRRY